MNREKSNLLEGSEIVQHHRTTSKDLPEIGVKLFEPSGSWFEGNKLSNALEERFSLLKEPRIEKDSVLSVAKWDPVKKKVVVLRKRGKEFETYGHHDSADNLDYLNPEEALFLVESNSLILQHGNREVGVELCYSLLLSEDAGCDLQQYRVFSHLSRLGYKLIRHKKPRRNDARVDNSCRTAEVNRSSVNVSTRRTEEDIVLIDDSSSDSSNDDVVILDVTMGTKDKEVIDIMDDDSSDSDILFVETPGLIELPLENWSYVHRSKFLSTTDVEVRQPTALDVFIVSQPEYEIMNEIPNIKSRKSWLFRPDERLLPDGVWPFHFKYLIDLNPEKNERGRGGYRGRGFRGRGWYLQRQVYQMKNYTMSLMNMVSQLMGCSGVEVIPPPPCLFQNNRFQRGGNRQTWGRISFNRQDSNYNANGVSITEIVELSDEEDSQKRVKTEQDKEDVKPKRIKLESDDLVETNSVKIEPTDIKREIKNERDKQPNLTDNVPIKSENIPVKTEKDKNSSGVDSNHVDESNVEISSQNKNSSDSVELSSRTSEKINQTMEIMNATDRSCEENVFGYSESVGDTDQAGDNISETTKEISEVHQDHPENFKITRQSEPCESVGNFDSGENSSVKSSSGVSALLDENRTVSDLEKCENTGSNDINIVSKGNCRSEKHVESLSNKTVETVENISCISDDSTENVCFIMETPVKKIPCRSEKSDDTPCSTKEPIENISCISEESVESVSCSEEPVKSTSCKTQASVKNPPSSSKQPVISIPQQSDLPMVIDDDSMDISVLNTDSSSKSSEHRVPCKSQASVDSKQPVNSKSQQSDLPMVIDDDSMDISVLNTDNSRKSSEQFLSHKSQASVKIQPSSSKQPVNSKSHQSDLPMVIDDDSLDISVLNTDNSNKSSERLVPCETSKSVGTLDTSDKRSNWKGLKEMEKEGAAQMNERVPSSQESVTNVTAEDKNEDSIDLGMALIQPEHCSSIDSVLKRLQIFKQYESPGSLSNCKDIKVTYDIYLPQRPYYRNLPPHPDFRLVILRLEDSFPSADELTQLKKTYNDKVNFLFAVALKESIAYYLYDNVFLPIDDSAL